MEITDYKQLAAYINARVKDEKAAMLLAGISEVEPVDLKGIGQMYRVLQVAFAVAYCKWLNKGASAARQGDRRHAEKVVALFELLYKAEPYSLDAVIYSLTEIKRDIMTNPVSLFRGVLSDDLCEYSRYHGIIYDWRKNLAGSERKQEILFPLMRNLVVDLAFLDGFAVVNDGGKITLRLGDEELDAHDVLYENEVGMWYILKERSAYGDSKYLTYVSLDDFSEIERIVKFR